MGIIELLIVVLVILWLLGYFGRGRFYASGPSVSTGTWGSGSLVHTLLVVAVILIILRLLGLI